MQVIRLDNCDRKLKAQLSLQFRGWNTNTGHLWQSRKKPDFSDSLFAILTHSVNLKRVLAVGHVHSYSRT